MKKNLFIVCYLFVTYFSFAQISTKEYDAFKKIGDSLYKLKDYKNAAIAYSSSIKIAGNNATIGDRYDNACSWALANYPDSAFAQLEIIANTYNLTFSDFENVGTDNDFISLYTDKRWKTIMMQMFATANKSFLSKLKTSGENISIQDWVDAAAAHALNNNADSSFFFLSTIANLKDISFKYYNAIKTDKSFISLYNDKRWQPIINAIIKNVATCYSSRVRSGNWTNPTLDQYDAAVAWSMANYLDSAFFYLNNIVLTNYNRFTDYNRLVKEQAFSPLYNDKRWQIIIEAIQKKNTHLLNDGNFTHRFNNPPVPMIFKVDPESSFLKSDGMGSYKNGADKVNSGERHAYNLYVSGADELMVSTNKYDTSTRFLILDLNSPVKGTGSVAQGVIKDNSAKFHVFYKIDTSVRPMLIYDFRDIPVGATIESERTEISVHIKGVAHMLALGSWGLGDLGEAYAYGGRINGAGTTKVKVTHNTETSFTIVAPQGSIGRLWNTQNMTMPVDRG